MRGRENPPSVVLFYRDFRGFTGGHLKVWHYYQHLKSSRRFRPSIFFSEHSVWNPGNPWFPNREECASTWDPSAADIVFLAGLDWLVLEGRPPLPGELPIVNLIQGARHADPDDVRYRFLSRKAVRICVSEQVTQCLVASGKINGPVFTIANGLDLDQLPSPKREPQRDIPVLIAGRKNPDFAESLAKRLQEHGVPAQLQLTTLPRNQFLEMLNRATVAVLLPLDTEGFYLPALEAMALGTLTVCPDCVGNRSFCRHDVNSFMPRYNLDEVLRYTLRAYNSAGAERERLISAARQTAGEHSLLQERRQFLEIMESLGQIW